MMASAAYGQAGRRHPGSFLFLTALMLGLCLACLGCGGPAEQEREPITNRELREVLERSNQLLLESEDQEIRDFVERYGWEVEETGSGLRYMFLERGEGPRAREGQWAQFHYRIYLLTGDLVYQSPRDEPGRFRIGRGGVESGLEEGILLMRQGDKARLIMPPHLAHGVPGDGASIPWRASIVYELELIKLQD